jgi:hypothetical protein
VSRRYRNARTRRRSTNEEFKSSKVPGFTGSKSEPEPWNVEPGTLEPLNS